MPYNFRENTTNLYLKITLPILTPMIIFAYHSLRKKYKTTYILLRGALLLDVMIDMEMGMEWSFISVLYLMMTLDIF